MAKKKKNSGWIKLYRQLQHNPIWQSSEPFSRRDAWIDLLLLANHEERVIIVNGKKKVIGEGQHWTSYRILADRWHWSYEKVRRYFALLNELDMVRITVTPNGSLVTIVNYSFFQSGRVTKCDANDSAGDRTDDRTDDRQTRTIQELNTRMNNKNKASPVFDSGGYEIEE
jgi:DNA replication protein DnaD